MQFEVLESAAAVAERGAVLVAEAARAATRERGRFTFAVSGGSTPWQMLAALAREDVPWGSLHLFQIDERVAPAGDSDRNHTHLTESLLARVDLPAENFHPMPVEEADLDAACTAYARTLAEIAGSPPVLDLVHLGLGPDGHTASLIPDDDVLQVSDRDVASTGVYQGRRRMTVTYPLLNRARRVLWLVTGESKQEMLVRLRDGDPTIPGGRVHPDRAIVVADRAAAAGLT